jgi:chromosome partitioning protein
MYVLAVVSQKGGSGKTTLALNLAVASQLSARATLVVDLDPQASAKSWQDHRADEVPHVISCQASRLTDVLDRAGERGVSLVILDTAPHSESAALTAARQADRVIIPCRPGILDIRAVANSLDIALLAKTPATAVLNAVPHQGRLADEAAAAITAIGLDVCPVRITHRAAFIHSLTASTGVMEYEAQGKAAAEITRLYKWICSQFRKSS